MAKKRTAPRSSASFWVKFISILFFIGSFLLIFGGLIILAVGAIGGTMLSNEFVEAFSQIDPEGMQGVSGSELLSFIAGILILIGIIVLVMGVLYFFIGLGLWKRKSWARILAIAVSIVFFIWGLFLFDIITLVINGLIGGYLLFSKEAKKLFQQW